AAGVRVEPGDFLLVRTGNARRRALHGPLDPPNSHPGLHALCLPWLKERGVAMLGCDCPNDVSPSGYPKIGLPIHTIGIPALGLWLIDNCNLEGLTETCARYGRWAFHAMVAPLKLK